MVALCQKWGEGKVAAEKNMGVSFFGRRAPIWQPHPQDDFDTFDYEGWMISTNHYTNRNL